MSEAEYVRLMIIVTEVSPTYICNFRNLFDPISAVLPSGGLYYIHIHVWRYNKALFVQWGTQILPVLQSTLLRRYGYNITRVSGDISIVDIHNARPCAFADMTRRETHNFQTIVSMVSNFSRT